MVYQFIDACSFHCEFIIGCNSRLNLAISGEIIWLLDCVAVGNECCDRLSSLVVSVHAQLWGAECFHSCCRVGAVLHFCDLAPLSLPNNLRSCSAKLYFIHLVEFTKNFSFGKNCCKFFHVDIHYTHWLQGTSYWLISLKNIVHSFVPCTFRVRLR